MATVTAFIRVSTKKTKEANVRFRLRDGRAVQLLYSSDITVKPEHWNPKKEELKAKILMDTPERADFNRKVALRKSQITDLYNAAPDKSVLTSEWLSAEMYKLLNPVVVKKQESSSSFFEDFDFFLEIRKLSDVRTRNFRVIYRDLQRFELYRRINVSKRFHLSFDSVILSLPAMMKRASSSVHVHINLFMMHFQRLVLRNLAVRILSTMYSQNSAHSFAGLWNRARLRTIRSSISQ